MKTVRAANLEGTAFHAACPDVAGIREAAASRAASVSRVKGRDGKGPPFYGWSNQLFANMARALTAEASGGNHGVIAADGVCSYHLRTRIARRVFHRLGLPSPSSIVKCSRPGWGFSRGQRPSASRFDSLRSIASLARS